MMRHFAAMPAITISARAVGRRQELVPDWQLPWSPDGIGGGEPLTLRQLITRVVLQEVDAFQQRQRERRVVRILTERQIEIGLQAGRVESGGRELNQPVAPEAAVAAALQAFEDGLYLVMLDGEEHRHLDREVHLRPDSHLVFIRLVMLAGG